MSKRLMAMLVALVALAAVVAGCGGGDEEESLTKAQYIKQGDAVCKETYGKYQKQFEGYVADNGIKENTIPNRKHLKEIAERFYDSSVEARLEGLEELNPPSADQEKIDAIYAATEDGLEKMQEDPLLLFDESPFGKANDLSVAYGFQVCGTT